jgi:hypothetical protein
MASWGQPPQESGPPSALTHQGQAYGTDPLTGNRRHSVFTPPPIKRQGLQQELTGPSGAGLEGQGEGFAEPGPIPGGG